MMRRILPHVRTAELFCILLWAGMLPFQLAEAMQQAASGRMVWMSCLAVVGNAGGVLCLLIDWRHRQSPDYWRRLNRSPRRPFPLSGDGTPIHD